MMSGVKTMIAAAACAAMLGCTSATDHYALTPTRPVPPPTAPIAKPTTARPIGVTAPVTAKPAAAVNVAPLPVPSAPVAIEVATPSPAVKGTIPFQPNPALKDPQPVKEPEKKKDQDPRQLEKRVLYQYQLESQAKYDALMQLKKQNPGKFRDEVQKLIVEQQKKLDEFNQLVAAYKRKPSPELKARIRATIAEVYDRQMKWEKGKVDWLENELKKQREEYRRHLEKRNRTLDEQLDKILIQRAKQW